MPLKYKLESLQQLGGHWPNKIMFLMITKIMSSLILFERKQIYGFSREKKKIMVKNHR